jgi:predicted nucleic acid-binding protein
MAGLAAVSTRLECKSLADLFQRLSGVEVAATIAALELLTIRGDSAAAIAKLKIKHFRACSDAFALALAHHFDGEEKNDQTAAAAG